MPLVIDADPTATRWNILNIHLLLAGLFAEVHGGSVTTRQLYHFIVATYTRAPMPKEFVDGIKNFGYDWDVSWVFLFLERLARTGHLEEDGQHFRLTTMGRELLEELMARDIDLTQLQELAKRL